MGYNKSKGFPTRYVNLIKDPKLFRALGDAKKIRQKTYRDANSLRADAAKIFNMKSVYDEYREIPNRSGYLEDILKIIKEVVDWFEEIKAKNKVEFIHLHKPHKR